MLYNYILIIAYFLKYIQKIKFKLSFMILSNITIIDE